MEPAISTPLCPSIRRAARGVLSSDRHLRVRLRDQIDGDSMDDFHTSRCATVSDLSVHANVCIEARDRMRLERRRRYAGRPAVATERLTALSDGRLLYHLKMSLACMSGAKRKSAGRSPQETEPALSFSTGRISYPNSRSWRPPLTRFHGIFGPAAAQRPLIIPRPDKTPDGIDSSPAALLDQTATLNVETEPAPSEPNAAHQRSYTWSELMKRVFLVDMDYVLA